MIPIENVQRKILVALAASVDEMNLPMIRRACGMEANADLSSQLQNLLSSGAIAVRKTGVERWFKFNTAWRSRRRDANEAIEAALARRGQPTVAAPATPEPIAASASATTSAGYGGMRPTGMVVDDVLPSDAQPEAAAPISPRSCVEAGGPGPDSMSPTERGSSAAAGGPGPDSTSRPEPASVDEPSLARQVLDRLVGLAHRGMTADAVRRSTSTAEAVSKPLGLRDRVEAVLTDVEDLVGDACDLQLDHDTIKAMVVSLAALQRAARKLPA